MTSSAISCMFFVDFPMRHVAKRALNVEMGGAHHLAPFADLVGDLIGSAYGDEERVARPA